MFTVYALQCTAHVRIFISRKFLVWNEKRFLVNTTGFTKKTVITAFFILSDIKNGSFYIAGNKKRHF